MRSGFAALLLLILGTGLAHALPPQWQIKYCHNYADTAVRYNQSRLAKGCLNGFERSPRWSNNWNSHYSWCINLSPDKISEAQSEASARLYVTVRDYAAKLADPSSGPHPEEGAQAPISKHEIEKGMAEMSAKFRASGARLMWRSTEEAPPWARIR